MNKVVRNEWRKLTATYINGVAIAVVAVGALAPAAGFAQTGVLSAAATALLVVCFMVSGALHLWALRWLRGMEE